MAVESALFWVQGFIAKSALILTFVWSVLILSASHMAMCLCELVVTVEGMLEALCIHCFI